jgi:hypothetical protein
LVEIALLMWFQDAEDGCELRLRPLGAEVPEERLPIGGACDITSVALNDAGVLLLRGEGRDASVWRVAGPEPTPEELGSPGPWTRHVAWSTEGGVLAFSSDHTRGDVTEEGAIFDATTWSWGDDGWTALEEVEERRLGARAVSGGPLWSARAPGASVDAWTLEASPGFELAMPNDIKLPKKLRFEGTLFWGRVPTGAGEIAVRYTVLGMPMPAGPVLQRTGKRWAVLDESHHLETPASVQVRGGYALLSYEGMNPLVVEMRSGKVVWRPEPEAWINGAMLR